MSVDEVSQLRVLKLKASQHGAGLGRLIDQAVESGELTGLRQMCAKVHPALYDRLEAITGLLDMSKREFIEGAVADAVARAEEAIERAGAINQGSL